MSAINQLKSPWYNDGVGLHVFEKLSSRAGKGWENGIVHRGGLHSGHWYLLHNQQGMRLRQILALYDTEREFLND